jgi:hypothetical protein
MVADLPLRGGCERYGRIYREVLDLAPAGERPGPAAPLCGASLEPGEEGIDPTGEEALGPG